MAKKKSKTQQEYQKERRRIQRRVRELEKRGYFFDVSPLPDVPKRITEGSVRRLQSIDLKKIYQAARYVDIETGEIISGRKRRNIERQEAAAKAAATRKRNQDIFDDDIDLENMVITQVLQFIATISFNAKEAADVIRRWLNDSLTKHGKAKVAKVIADAIESDRWIKYEDVYMYLRGGGVLIQKLDALSELMQLSDEDKQKMIDSLEVFEDIGI